MLISISTYKSFMRKMDKQGLTLDLCMSCCWQHTIPSLHKGLVLHYFGRILVGQMQMAKGL